MSRANSGRYKKGYDTKSHRKLYTPRGDFRFDNNNRTCYSKVLILLFCHYTISFYTKWRPTMFRKILLIFLFCGLTVLSVVLEYRATAETSTCSPRGLCIRVKPPDCVKPDCDVTRPLLRLSCAHRWQQPLIGDTIRSPQDCTLCLEIINSQRWRRWQRCPL